MLPGAHYTSQPPARLDLAVLLHYISIQHPVLLQVVRDYVLRQKRRFQRNFGANPFTPGMRQFRGVFADSARTESRPESCALNLFELAEILPGFVSYGAGNIDFQFYDRHECKQMLRSSLKPIALL